MNKIYKFLPIFFLALFTLIIFKAVIFEGKLPIPADTIVGLYHPWRDFYSSQSPNGLPFKNFLITDPVRQQYVWRELAIKSYKADQLPNWNPYSLSGTPLKGNLQAAVFYPLNVLYLFGDFASIWSVQVVLQVVLGGIFMILYLRNLKLHSLAQTLGMLSWVGSGFFVAWLEWNVLVQVAIWLPLLLLSIDKIFESQRKTIWFVIFPIAVSFSFLAGHLQIFFYVSLLSFFYVIFRVLESKKWKLLIYFAFAAAVSTIATAWQWIPMLDLFKYGVRSIDANDYLSPGWFLPIQNLAQFFAPDFFGNPATLNYFGVWNYGEMVGYFGLIGLVFSLFSFFFLKNKTLLFFILSIIICLIFSLPTPLAKLPFELKLPFFSSAQPTRLIVLVDFALSILAAFGLDYFLKEGINKKKIIFPIALIGVVLSSLVLFAYSQHLSISLHNLVIPGFIFILSSVLVLLLVLKTKFPRNLVPLITIIIILISLIDLSRFSNKFESFSDRKYLFPQTKVINFLQKEQRKSIIPFRIATTDDRIMPPNFAAHFGLEDISGYDSIFVIRYAQLIAAFGRNKPDLSQPFGFNRMIVPKNVENNLYQLLGVKYLLSLDDIKSPVYKLVLNEGQTKVYENQMNSRRLYFADSIVGASNKQEAINELFSQNFSIFRDAVVEDFPYTNGNNSFNYDSNNETKINQIRYSANEILAITQNNTEGFLVFNDVAYPDWQAAIDGIETKIYLTNYAFRGIIVPQGKHTVRFFYE